MINYFDRDRMDNAGHQLLNTLEVLPIGHDEAVEDHYQEKEYMKAEEYLKKVFMMFPDFSKEEKVPGFKDFIEQIKMKMEAVNCYYEEDYKCFKEKMKKALEIYPGLSIKETDADLLREIEKIKKKLGEEEAKELYLNAKKNFANNEYSKADENLKELFRNYPDFFETERNKKFRKKVKEIRRIVAEMFSEYFAGGKN